MCLLCSCASVRKELNRGTPQFVGLKCEISELVLMNVVHFVIIHMLQYLLVIYFDLMDVCCVVIWGFCVGS